MSIKGIIFISIAILGAIINFASRKISEKSRVSELKIKLCALIIVIVAVALLMIYGK